LCEFQLLLAAIIECSQLTNLFRKHRRGAGLKPLSGMHKPMSEVIPEGTVHVPGSVKSFEPEKNQVTTAEGDVVS